MSTLQELVGGLSPRAKRVYQAFAHKATNGVPIVSLEATLHWWAAYKKDTMLRLFTASLSDQDPLLRELRKWAPPNHGGVLYYPLVAVHFWDLATPDQREVAKSVLRLLNIPLSILDKNQPEPDPLARFQYI